MVMEYPWKSEICSVCKNFGHKNHNCVKGKKVWRPEVAAPVVVPDPVADQAPATAQPTPWQLIQRHLIFCICSYSISDG